jgi:PAS domain S-box-containing protein
MQSTLEENDKQFSRKNAFLRASAPLREKKEKNVIALRRWDAGKNLKKVVLVSEKLSCEKLQKRIRELESLETELRETEVLLKDEIKWQRLLFEESRDAIVVLDQGGNVYAANNRFAEMLGYSKEEVYHLHTWDWDVHFDKEQILDLAESVNREGHHFETQHRRKDGTIPLCQERCRLN